MKFHILAAVFFFSIFYFLFTIYFSKPAYAHTFSSQRFNSKIEAESYDCGKEGGHPHQAGTPVEEFIPPGFTGKWIVICTNFVPDTGPIGTITPPDNIPVAMSNDPSNFIAGLVRASLRVLLIVAFILALIWTIFAGYRFIFAGGDPKNITAAWSQIYWGLLGMAIVLGAFAIIRLVEVFFKVTILSGDFQLPQR